MRNWRLSLERRRNWEALILFATLLVFAVLLGYFVVSNQFLVIAFAVLALACISLAFTLRQPIIVIVLTIYSLVLSQSFTVTQIGERPINASPDYILIPLLLLSVLLAGTVAPKSRTSLRLPASPFYLPYVIFSSVAVITLMLSVAERGVAVHVPAFVETAKYFLYSLLFVSVAFFVKDEADARLLLSHLLLAAIIVVLIGLFQVVTIPDRNAAPVGSTFGSFLRDDVGNKNSLGIYAGMIVVMLAAVQHSTLLRRRTVVVVIGLAAILTLWTFSRAAVFGMGIAGLWLWLTRPGKKAHKRRARVGCRLPVVSATLIVVVIGAFVYSAANGFNRFTPVGAVIGMFGDPAKNFAATGLHARWNILVNLAIPVLWDRPFLGSGFQSMYIYHPILTIVDNFFLHIYLSTGLIGLMCMLALIASVLRTLTRISASARRRGDTLLAGLARGLSACWVLLFAASVSGSFPFTGRLLGTIVILLGIVIKLDFLGKGKENCNVFCS